jgi:hypothetical protein
VHVVKSKDRKIPPRLQLAKEWQPSRDPNTGRLIAAGRLWDFTESIASSRREGKNRRDGATVSTRVLRLTDLLGAKLFADVKKAAIDGKSGAPVTLSQEEQKHFKRSVKESRRRRTLEARAHL